MKNQIRIEIKLVGFPMIYDIFGEGFNTYASSNNTLSELIEDLIERYGERFSESLKDQRTKTLDPSIQIMINGEYILSNNFDQQRIAEGDKITILRLLAGG
jgi:sulfur carrier protein ThiS